MLTPGFAAPRGAVGAPTSLGAGLWRVLPDRALPGEGKETREMSPGGALFPSPTGDWRGGTCSEHGHEQHPRRGWLCCSSTPWTDPVVLRAQPGMSPKTAPPKSPPPRGQPLPSSRVSWGEKRTEQNETNGLETARSTDQEEMPEAPGSPAEFRDCKEECKLSWWAEDLSSK